MKKNKERSFWKKKKRKKKETEKKPQIQYG